MSYSNHRSTPKPFIRPPSQDYDDEVLYGARRAATRRIELFNEGNKSDCVIYTIGSFVDSTEWKLKNLIGLDRRIEAMMSVIGITHALPIQRHCWPQMHRAKFPFVCVAPQSTGKTYTHLIYIVSKCISAIPISQIDEIIIESSLDAFQLSTTISSNRNSGNNVNSSFNDLNGSSNNDSKPWAEIETEQQFDVNPDDYIMHPKFIIICSSQQHVELISREIERMKSAAYGERVTEAQIKRLPPKVGAVNVYQEHDKLALRCNESEILIATPEALIKCCTSGYVTFAKCKMVFFDDLDLTLQLHNSSVRELIKQYLIQTQLDNQDVAGESSSFSSPSSSSSCQVFMFSRKWTDLVKQFVSTVFLQRTLIFGSIVEASLYANLRYDLEATSSETVDLSMAKLADLVNLYSNNALSQGKKVAIICKADEEAEQVSLTLSQLGHNTKFLPKESALLTLNLRQNGGGLASGIRGVYPRRANIIYVMSDGALEFIVDLVNDMTHLIHYSLPDEMLVFDQRFRLMYKNIRDFKNQKNQQLMATIFLDSKLNVKHAKELYDMISRSSTTLKSTKLELRDFISDSSNTICWRWASAGLCRLEKLSREDRFGSYCPNRHSLQSASPDNKDVSHTNHHNGSSSNNGSRTQRRWPMGGQVKITITHLVSPNEFYFWFESHRDLNSPISEPWTKLANTGSVYMKELQHRLNRFKDTPSCSIPLSHFKKGKVYGFYSQQELKVDRIVILEEPKKDDETSINGFKKNGLLSLAKLHYQLKYSKQYQVFKIDYGVHLSVYLRNIFELPESLASVPPQCHRAFLLGVKPTHGEPNWLYKAKRFFYDQVCVENLHEIIVWMRLNSQKCFWFEHMIVARALSSSIEGGSRRFFRSEPLRELCQAGLADRTQTEPSCLNPSERLTTLSKWHVDKSKDYAQYAFLDRDKIPLSIFILNIDRNNLDLLVRQTDFNEQLIRLEDKLITDYSTNKLQALSYFAAGVYCLAKIPNGQHPSTKEPIYTINRCKIIERLAQPMTNIRAEQQHDSISTADDNIEDNYMVECLDHGDKFVVNKRDLYHAPPDCLRILPFQAVKCRLADLNQELLIDKALLSKTISLIYDYTRAPTEQMKKAKCSFKGQDEIYVYAPADVGLYVPLVGLFEREHGIKICTDDDPNLRNDLEIEAEVPEVAVGDDEEERLEIDKDMMVRLFIGELLKELIREELSAAGVKVPRANP